MVTPTSTMLLVFVLICFVFPCVSYLRKRNQFVDIIDDEQAESLLRKRGYHSVILKKYRNNIYALRPGARCREEVSLNARHQSSTNIWNMIEYSLVVYGCGKGRPVEVYQCDWTQERQQKLVEFLEIYNFATLPEHT